MRNQRILLRNVVEMMGCWQVLADASPTMRARGDAGEFLFDVCLI